MSVLITAQLWWNNSDNLPSYLPVGGKVSNMFGCTIITEKEETELVGREIREICLFLTAGSSEALEDTLEDTRHSVVSASPEPSIAGSTMSASVQHRTNMTMHVCWHRSLSVSASEHAVAFRVCLLCTD